MEEQVRKYTYNHPETKKEYFINASFTMGENIADLGGINLACKTLIKYLDENDLLNSLTINTIKMIVRQHKRILFKSWANIWKENVKIDKKIMFHIPI